jgi:GNAT superfamily N-acetyltransferase
MRNSELCGVIVYTYPSPACHGRSLILPKMGMKDLNLQLSTINRVVVHPKYRTMGLGARLIRETLSLAGTPYVELIAVMAKYSPFAEKAGMKKVAVQEPSADILKTAEILRGLGFDLRLLGSQPYVLAELARLTDDQIVILRGSLQRSGHPRFRKEFAISRHVPYGKTAEFKKCIAEADLPKLGRLLKIVGMLLQTKVYLFWKSPVLETHNG